MGDRYVDIIWNITQVCPWNCMFCCTDAVQVTKKKKAILLKERSLQELRIIDPSTYQYGMYNSLQLLQEKGIKPTLFDIALADRQQRGLELTYEEKLQVLNNLLPASAKIDFAGGDPLVCYENYFIVEEAARLFGKERISITSTGAGLGRYDLENLASLIGKFEFTFDEQVDILPCNRPKGYNLSNLKAARIFSDFGVKTKAQLPINQGNVKTSTIEAIYKALNEAQIDELLLMRIFPVGRGTTNFQDKWQVSRETHLRVIDKFRSLEMLYAKPSIRLQCALRYLEEKSNNENPCDLMHTSFGINWKGLLLLSAWATNSIGDPLDDAFVLGNLTLYSLEELLSTSKAQNYVKRLDENFGHCKIFSFLFSKSRTANDLFSPTDPLYSSH